jgi:CxxC-x17-CxxC domain-containing protein
MAMHQGNWQCSTCDGTITELPFIPRSETGLTCRDCWSKNHKSSPSVNTKTANSTSEIPDDVPLDAGLASEPMPTDDGFADATPITPGERKMFEGDWSCAHCGGAITSLPFNPRDTSNLKCLDCFKASKS